MAEPASSTAGVAIAAGAITITGSIFGIQYDALLMGFFGGLVALSYLPPTPLLRTAGSVISSSLIAGWFAPIIGVAIAHYMPWISGAGETAVRMSIAAAFGLGWQTIVPAALARLGKILEGKS